MENSQQCMFNSSSIPPAIIENYTIVDSSNFCLQELFKHFKAIFPSEMDSQIDRDISYNLNLATESINKNLALLEDTMNLLKNKLSTAISFCKDDSFKASRSPFENSYSESNLIKDSDEIINKRKALDYSINSFDYHYIHSEQKLLYYLYSEKGKSFLTSLAEKISNKESILEIYLSIHSQRNFCRICRRTLVNQLLSQKLGNYIKSFFSFTQEYGEKVKFNIIGSFRMHYLMRRESLNIPDLWMPGTVDEDEDQNNQGNNKIFICEIDSSQLILNASKFEKNQLFYYERFKYDRDNNPAYGKKKETKGEKGPNSRSKPQGSSLATRGNNVRK